MTDLEWTDEPPEEEGWYWVRKPKYHEVGGRDLVVPVREAKDGLYAKIQSYGEYKDVAELPDDIKWAGPIPRPSDPHQDA
jgi:hypothetical protein